MVYQPDIEPGSALTGSEVSALFKCQHQKGMRCSRATNSLVVIVDRTHRHRSSIYRDEWIDEVLHYRGTGQLGDEDIEYEGNRWLRDSETRGTGVHLFVQRIKGQYRYVGRVKLANDPCPHNEPDRDGNIRRVWVFPLQLAAPCVDDFTAVLELFGDVETVTEIPPHLSVAVIPEPAVALPDSSASHDEIQLLLLQMGARLGLDVWVARNDRNKTVKGQLLACLPRMREALPAQFEAQVMRIIEHIDVLWLRGHSVEAAFEIEHTTSVYSGLLRMADLIAVHPNILIRLYVVAPDTRKTKVLQELTRPTFEALEPPLRTLCGCITYSALLVEADAVSRYGSQLKPGFLHEIAAYAESASPAADIA